MLAIGCSVCRFRCPACCPPLNRCVLRRVVRLTEIDLALVFIVGATPQFDVLDAGFATIAVRRVMMELQEPSFGATAPISAFESALPIIPLRHRAAHGRRDVPRTL